MLKNVRKAVIPAAGFGTRFLPVTKAVPKELLPIIDRPVIEVVMRELAQAGIEEFILVISKGKEALLDYFKPKPELEKELELRGKHDLLKTLQEPTKLGKITAIYQDHPRGLGHAVLCAQEAVGNEPFMVALSDDLIFGEPPCAAQMVARFKEHGRPLVAVQEVELKDVGKYGIVEPRYPVGDERRYLDSEERLMVLKDLIEKPEPKQAPSRMAIVGRYVLIPEIFAILEKTEKGSGGEIQLTDALKTLNTVHEIAAYRFKGARYDAGDKLGFLQANIIFAMKHPDLGAELRALIRRFSEVES